MVNDILENTKSEVLFFTSSLINSENAELKQILEQLRTTLEAFYSELFTLAVSKGYYAQTIKAKPEDITQIKNLFI